MNWESYGITPYHLDIFGYTFAFHFVVITLIWLAGRKHKNDSILDIYWGFAYVVTVWMAYILSNDVSDRGILVLTLVTIWTARLGYHLLARWARIHGLGGDLRYQDIKDNWLGSKNYNIKAFFAVYFPMWLCYIISQANMIMVITTPDQPPLGTLDYIFGTLMVMAFIYEAVSDLQLDAFKANPGNEGKVLNTGCWGWSRHPNYFANLSCFWCVFIISLSVPGLLWTIISPLFMSWLLVRFTGVPLMDEHMRKRRPQYAEYIEKTSSFIPMPPKKK